MEPDKPLDKNPLSRQQPAIEPPRASFILKNAATEGTILNAETQRNAEKRRETQRNAEKKNPLRISLRTSAPSALNLRTLRSNWGIAVRRARRNAEKKNPLRISGVWTFCGLESSQSQRDCITQPGVARRALPRVRAPRTNYSPTRNRLHPFPARMTLEAGANDATHTGLLAYPARTQGSARCATLG